MKKARIGLYKHRLAVTKGVGRKSARKLFFEPDIDEPQSIEFLAAQQRRFLADNKQEWIDVELPDRHQRNS
jgi:hypothetical protein